MSFEIIFVFCLLGLAFFLFITNYVTFDIAALIIVVLLAVSGILTIKETLAGFSNPATLTIAAMFILSEGLRSTGILNKVGDYFTKRIQKNFWSGLLQMLLLVSLCSAFINNTAVIVIFIPVMLDIAAKIKLSPTKLLMPLSFAGIFGGICTLIGTSTNILVSSIAQDRGLETLSMFEFSPFGLILLGIGFIYMFFIGIKNIPSRRENEQLTSGYQLQNYLTDVVIETGNSLIDKIFDENDLTKELDLDVLRIFKSESNTSPQRHKTTIGQGDVLRIKGNAEEIKKLIERDDFSLKPSRVWKDIDLEHGSDVLVEAIVTPDSFLVGKTPNNINFAERFEAVPLAVRHHGKTIQEDLWNRTLRGGDSLLLNTNKNRLQQIDGDQSFIVASELGISRKKPKRAYIVLAIIAAVVLTAALNITPIVVSALAGVTLLIISGCLSVEEAYTAINWKVIVLLAGVIPLGTAMDKSGAATLIADQMIHFLSGMGPRAVMSGFFLLTMIITAVMSNNASAALLAPIAIETAHSLEVNPYPFLFAVTFAASLSFITPFGYQTNTLIYGTGNYKFSDFSKVGAPLNLLFWIAATFLIPIFWPF